MKTPSQEHDPGPTTARPLVELSPPIVSPRSPPPTGADLTVPVVAVHAVDDPGLPNGKLARLDAVISEVEAAHPRHLRWRRHRGRRAQLVGPGLRPVVDHPHRRPDAAGLASIATHRRADHGQDGRRVATRLSGLATSTATPGDDQSGSRTFRPPPQGSGAHTTRSEEWPAFHEALRTVARRLALTSGQRRCSSCHAVCTSRAAGLKDHLAAPTV